MRQGKVVQSCTYYILGSNHRIFYNVAVRYLRHNSDHFMVLGSLSGSSTREHNCCLRRRTRLPLHRYVRQTKTRADKIFAELRRSIPKPDKRVARHKFLDIGGNL